MAEFAGWDMPITYPGGAIQEHRLVRRSAGLFDVSHMGQFLVSGPDALDYLQRLVTTNLATVSEQESTYALLCRYDGGVLDDLFLYNLPDHWLIVVNAANREKDFSWFERHLPESPAGEHLIRRPDPARSPGDGSPDPGPAAGPASATRPAAGDASAAGPGTAPRVRLEDVSEVTAMIAFQGPSALSVMDHLTDGAASSIPRFGAAQRSLVGLPQPFTGRPVTIGRTGYTGEDGVELFVPDTMAQAVWELILAEAEQAGVEAGPVGLAARDSLRFEPGFALYGHELTEEITPLEARLKWACDLEKEFIGRDALLAQREKGLEQRLATVKLTQRGVPREGYRVLKDGEPVGVVATGMYAPTADAYCANVFVPPALAKTGTEVDIDIRGRIRSAVVVKRPLYRPAYR